MNIRRRTNGLRACVQPTLDLPRLIEILGRMKVGELARLAEVSVEQVVGNVVRARELPTFPRSVPTARRTPLRVVVPSPGVVPRSEPALAELVGRATLEEIDAVVDRWMLAVVLHEHGWNVTHTAARLGISRRRLRVRWAAVRGRRIELADPEGQESGEQRQPSAVSQPPSLARILATGGRYHDVRGAVRRWFVACSLELEGGNVTHTARVLGKSRRAVRELCGLQATHG